VATTRPRVLEFGVSVDRSRAAHSSLGGSPIASEDAWSAEHLVLAGLVRCTLASLDHHVRRAGLVASASGTAHAIVTKRETDGLYAFVDVETRYDVEFADAFEPEKVTELLDKAERGCFVGNSLVARPRYRWTVNGKNVR